MGDNDHSGASEYSSGAIERGLWSEAVDLRAVSVLASKNGAHFFYHMAAERHRIEDAFPHGSDNEGK